MIIEKTQTTEHNPEGMIYFTPSEFCPLNNFLISIIILPILGF